MTGLRVMTYNIGGFHGADGRVDIDRVAAVIAEGAPDLVALQQCPLERHPLEQLANRLGMRVYTSAGDGAYLADLPLRGVRSFDLGGGGSCLRADADLGGRRLHLFNARLTGGCRNRDSQVRALLGSDLLGHRDLAGSCLLLGELPGLIWRLRLAGELRSVPRPWWSPTTPAHRPIRTHARAYLCGALQADSGQVLFSPAARRAATHLPFLFTIQLTDTRHYLRLDPDKHFSRRGQMEIAPG